MEDGVYFNLPDETYHAEKRLSSSGIRDILDNPTYYWFNSNFNPLKEEKKTEALTDGRIFHALVLERENFKNKFKVTPPEIEALNKNCTEYRVWKSAQELEVIPYAKFQKFNQICEYLKQDGQLLDCTVIKGGYPEVSIFWTEDGIKRKARIDYLKRNAIIDLKTFVKRNKAPLNSYVSQYFFSYRVYLQLIYYKHAVEFAKEKGLNVNGNYDQRIFFAGITGELMTMAVFVNREIPQSSVKVFLKDKCPDLWKLGEKQIQDAEEVYKDYMKKYGAKSAWLQDMDALSAELSFTDADFPQSFYELLQGVE
jgi:hypothetical protein